MYIVSGLSPTSSRYIYNGIADSNLFVHYEAIDINESVDRRLSFKVTRDGFPPG